MQGRPLYPEVRVGSISKQGEVRLDFTHTMRFPDNFAILINERSSDKLIEVYMLNGDTKEIDQNLSSWTVTSTSSTNINIILDFEKPILVSAGTYPDLLIIQVFLSAYPDKNN